MPDRIGNLYGTPDRKDRKYGAGGRLEEDEEFFYHYDDEGNLIYKELRTLQDGVVNYRRKEEEKELNIKFRSTGTGWRYDWQSNGMLKRVIRPDEKAVHFRYDALGRRTAKMFKGTVTRWVWDGNVPLHEWEYKTMRLQVPSTDIDKKQPPVEPTEDITTWIFEAGTFVPAAKIKGDKQYSIVTDYLGTPIQMYDEQGDKTWDCTLDVYGKVANFEGRSLSDCPFRYQGQYKDEEIGLYYNRFRYYSPETGNYISQDPIRLNGGNPTLYGYVHNPVLWIDIFGQFIVFRGMDSTSSGRPVVYSGETKDGKNAANSLGVRPGEAGMSTSITTEGIQPHRKSPEFGGTRVQSKMYSIDTDVLDKYGLEAIKDGDTHVSIKTKEGVNPDELGDRLAETEKEWKHVH